LKIFDLNRLTETVSAYIETRIELLKLDFQEQFVRFMAKALTWGIMLLCGLTILFFLSFGLAALLNELLESKYLGFMLVAGLYLLIAVVVYLSRNLIERRIHQEVSDFENMQEDIKEDEQ